ncbi:MAG TPA: hypothetical protein DHV17_04920 [Chitinophagaceae bacterium]|nr:hypothetical protein [Chitinophagaceae bacterium]
MYYLYALVIAARNHQNHTSYITNHTSKSYIIHHTSYITNHTSYITNHTSQIIHHNPCSSNNYTRPASAKRHIILKVKAKRP